MTGIIIRFFMAAKAGKNLISHLFQFCFFMHCILFALVIPVCFTSFAFAQEMPIVEIQSVRFDEQTDKLVITCIVAVQGDSDVTDRGIVWSFASEPTLEDNRTPGGSGAGEYAVYIPSPFPSTIYYIRAYATNASGTSLSDQISFSLPVPGCTDNDLDGYPQETECGDAVDCDDSDPQVHPHAEEDCYDQKDNDCDLAVDCLDPDCFSEFGCFVNNPPRAPRGVRLNQVGDDSVVITLAEYYDPEGDSHAKTHWLVRRKDDVYGNPNYPESFSHTSIYPGGFLKHTVTELESGILYVWKARFEDSGNALSPWSEEYEFYVGAYQLADYGKLPQGKTAKDFKLYAMSVWPYENDSESVFQTACKNTRDFTIARYDPAEEGYIPCAQGFDLEPGTAFWIISAQKDYHLKVEGVSVNYRQDFHVPLQYHEGNGWNMIGCPTRESYIWDNLKAVRYAEDGSGVTEGPVSISSPENKLVDSRIWRYRDGRYLYYSVEGAESEGDPAFLYEPVIGRYEGFWVRSLKENVSILFVEEAHIVPEDTYAKGFMPAKKFASVREKSKDTQMPRPLASTNHTPGLFGLFNIFRIQSALALPPAVTPPPPPAGAFPGMPEPDAAKSRNNCFIQEIFPGL